MEVIGADIGYGFTKVVCKRAAIQYPSVVVERPFIPITIDVKDESQNEMVEYQGKCYLYGNRASKYSKKCIFAQRHTSFIETKTYEVLVKSTLGYADEGQLFYVTGLPVCVFENEDIREAYRKRISSLLSPECMVKLVPQGIGAFYHVVLDQYGNPVNRQYLFERCAVVDIGQYTTDIVVLDRMDVVESHTVTLGISVACESLIQEIQRQYQRELSMHEAAQILRKHRLIHSGEQINISGLVETILNNTFDLIFTAVIDRIGKGEDMYAVVFAGGGSVVFEEKIKKIFKAAYFPLHPVFANAYGYYKYGIRQIKRMQT